MPNPGDAWKKLTDEHPAEILGLLGMTTALRQMYEAVLPIATTDQHRFWQLCLDVVAKAWQEGRSLATGGAGSYHQWHREGGVQFSADDQPRFMIRDVLDGPLKGWVDLVDVQHGMLLGFLPSANTAKLLVDVSMTKEKYGEILDQIKPELFKRMDDHLKGKDNNPPTGGRFNPKGSNN